MRYRCSAIPTELSVVVLLLHLIFLFVVIFSYKFKGTIKVVVVLSSHLEAGHIVSS